MAATKDNDEQSKCEIIEVSEIQYQQSTLKLAELALDRTVVKPPSPRYLIGSDCQPKHTTPHPHPLAPMSEASLRGITRSIDQ